VGGESHNSLIYSAAGVRVEQRSGGERDERNKCCSSILENVQKINLVRGARGRHAS